MRLLIIEDEGDLGELLKSNLARRGFAVDWYGTRADAEAALAIGTYDLILLDRRLPDGDGLDLLRHLRAAGSATPVIVITAQDAVADRVEGLNSGGDDYLVKPFATDELVARINAVLRRPAQAHNQVLRVGNIALDPGTREVRVADKPALLPRRAGSDTKFDRRWALCSRRGG